MFCLLFSNHDWRRDVYFDLLIRGDHEGVNRNTRGSSTLLNLIHTTHKYWMYAGETFLPLTINCCSFHCYNTSLVIGHHPPVFLLFQFIIVSVNQKCGCPIRQFPLCTEQKPHLLKWAEVWALSYTRGSRGSLTATQFPSQDENRFYNLFM